MSENRQSVTAGQSNFLYYCIRGVIHHPSFFEIHSFCSLTVKFKKEKEKPCKNLACWRLKRPLKTSPRFFRFNSLDFVAAACQQCWIPNNVQVFVTIGTPCVAKPLESGGQISCWARKAWLLWYANQAVEWPMRVIEQFLKGRILADFMSLVNFWPIALWIDNFMLAA